MATNLNNILEQIKVSAIAAGFKTVEEIDFNLKEKPDTGLPRLFIRLLGINYSNLVVDSSNEEYKLELIIIINTTPTPVSTLKTLMDELLKQMFTVNTLLATLARSQKFELNDADLSNDRDLFAKFGGVGVTLRMNINNMNNFGEISCQ